MPIKVIETYDDCQMIHTHWNDIISKYSRSIHQLDVTSTFEWTMVLWRTRLSGTREIVLLLEKDGSIAGILPLYWCDKVIHHLKCRRIAPLTDLYSGRNGFILNEPIIDNLESIIRYLYEHLQNWDVFESMVVDGSYSDRLLQDLIQRRGYRYEKISRPPSPYIVFDRTWQEFLNSRPRKFRWALRDGKKKMTNEGELVYREYTSGEELKNFFEAMLDIERGSWKEVAETSVTTHEYQETFYKEFMKIAGERGWFCGHLLELNGEPVAYIYGLLYNDIFYDLKESYKAYYKEMSPGHILKTFVFERLYERNVHLYDFMGECERYKMRWTDKTYSRSTYVMYNTTLRGLGAWLSAKVASSTREHRKHRRRHQVPGVQRAQS